MRYPRQRITSNLVGRHLHTSAVSGRRPGRSFHLATPATLPRKRHFFTSNPFLSTGSSNMAAPIDTEPSSSKSSPPPSDDVRPPHDQATGVVKRKTTRSATAKTSLRRVAIIAQRPKRAGADEAHDGRTYDDKVNNNDDDDDDSSSSSSSNNNTSSNSSNNNTSSNSSNNNTSSNSSNNNISSNSSNNNTSSNSSNNNTSSNSNTSSNNKQLTTMSATCVAESFDMSLVVEILSSHGFAIDPDKTGFDATEVVHARGVNGGDIFVFPSGTIVTWSLPPDVVTKQLLRAAHDAHPPALREAEDLDFATDVSRAESTIKGDRVVLGTRREHTRGDRLDTTLAKIAFSSGLARSTKLAVLESALTSYFESTRDIPAMLSRGSGLPLSLSLGRRFILGKTGELLSLRARLNHYSELTDSLPDLFWDSRSELGLEAYYDQVGRALDVNVRIRALNQKMDYAQEIAAVLREMSSEQHGTRLEIIIILLIFVEVVFELRRILLESRQSAERPAQTGAPRA